MNRKSSLPSFCALFDELIAEIAGEKGRDATEVKEAVLQNIEEQS